MANGGVSLGRFWLGLATVVAVVLAALLVLGYLDINPVRWLTDFLPEDLD